MFHTIVVWILLNPSALTDIKEVKKSDLQNVFNLKVIKAERNMDESEIRNADQYYEMFEQLRPVSVPGKAHSPDDQQR